ncbi:MAG: hypothetical protein HOI47_28160 [Candidatus Scalindua sp.]|nr:hypothetical protein [Candidatus Scalindua sp.]
MYWLDIAAISVILVFGIMRLSGWLNRLRGLVFGVLLGTIVIGLTPIVLSKYYMGSRINPEQSVIMKYLDKFVPDSIREKQQIAG